MSTLWFLKKPYVNFKFRFARRITLWFGESEFSVGYLVQLHIIGRQTDRQTDSPERVTDEWHEARQTDRQRDTYRLT